MAESRNIELKFFKIFINKAASSLVQASKWRRREQRRCFLINGETRDAKDT